MPPNLDTGQLLVWLSFFRSQCPGPGSGGVLSCRSCALVPLSGSWGALRGGPCVGTLGYRAPGSVVPILTALSWDSLAPHSPALLWRSSAALNHRKEKQSHQVGTAAVCFFSAAALASVTSGCDGPTSWGCPVSWGAGLCSWGPSPLLFRAGVIPSCLCVLLSTCFASGPFLGDGVWQQTSQTQVPVMGSSVPVDRDNPGLYKQGRM